MSARLLTFAALLAASACAPDLRDEYPFDGATNDNKERVTFEDLGNGVTRAAVDASSKEAWVYLDLDVPKELPVGEALDTQKWDLSFQRFKIVSNSGASGPGSVEVAALPGQDFAALTQAPASGYQPDEPDGADSNSDVDSAFLKDDGWYLYDLVKHRLQARDIVYVVHTGDGAYFKLQPLAYYDAAGNAGVISFDFALVLPP